MPLFRAITIFCLALLLPSQFACHRETQKVTGQIDYQPKIILAPDAELQIKLLDTSEKGPGGAVIAEKKMKAKGEGPFSFELPYDPKKINPDHSYALTANLRNGDKLLFLAKQRYPVITQGHPQRVQVQLKLMGNIRFQTGKSIVR